MPKIEAVPIRCQFCGSSKFKRQDNSNLLQCQYCEGLTAISSEYSVSDINFEIATGDSKKNDLLRRLRYFIEHEEFDMADKALEEARYNYPGDYNFEFCQKTLKLKTIVCSIRKFDVGFLYDPHECASYFEDIEFLKQEDIDISFFIDEVKKIYSKIPYGTIENTSGVSFSNDWATVKISKTFFSPELKAMMEMIQKRAIYENLIYQGNTIHNNYRLVSSKKTSMLASVVGSFFLFILSLVLLKATTSGQQGFLTFLLALAGLVLFFASIGSIAVSIIKGIKDNAQKALKAVEAKKEVDKIDAEISTAKTELEAAESAIQ